MDEKQNLSGRMGQGDVGSSEETKSLPDDAPALERDDQKKDEFQSDAEITVTFRSNGTLETVTRTGMIDSTKTGSWRLLSYDAEKLTARVECTLNSQVTEHGIEWLDKDSIKMTPPNMAGLTMKLIFRRAD